VDSESANWLETLGGDGNLREEALARLHRFLLRIAHCEANRRAPMLPAHTVADFTDLCLQAANDALMAITGKLKSYRGLSRFTTWAAKFVILEISSRLRRHAWRDRKVEWTEASWERLSDSRPTAQQAIEQNEELDRVHQAVASDLTERQRVVLTAAALEDVPIDVLAERLGSTRGAIYKILHDARLRLRQVLSSKRMEERS
jgi:RNA polymerase sigma-70 factor (ECF subfamily)